MVVDDDQDIVELKTRSLIIEQFKAVKAYSGEEALSVLEERPIDFVILDIMMPDMDGFEVCRYIRNKNNIPILFLSARDRDIDKIIGLEIGGDDYMTKPFSIQELTSRIKAHFRKVDRLYREWNEHKQEIDEINMVSGSLLVLNDKTFEAYLDNKKLDVSTKEFQILSFLVRNPNNVLTREQIYEHITTDYWAPIKTHDNHVMLILEIERPVGLIRIYDTYLNLEYIEVLLPLLILIDLVFVILTIYFYFNITQPIGILNTRIKSVNIGRSFTSLFSKSKKRNDEIGELYYHVNEMEERLYLARKEQIDMIAAIAHDLKTPLTTINGFVELLIIQKNLSEGEKHEYYELILKKSKHIKELINDFSAFTKGELELETIDMKATEALKLFENIAEEYETELSGLDYELIWKHSFSLNQFLIIDEHMIRRVFGNLFSNAVRYGEKKDLKVYMSGYRQGHYAYLQVEDNGTGVPDKELSSLFLKFFTPSC